MKKFIKLKVLIGLLIINNHCLICQTLKKDSFSLTTLDKLKLSGVLATISQYKGVNSIKIELEPQNNGGDAASFAKLSNIAFKDGIIKVNLVGKLGPNAPDWARGFVGIAFRIKDDNSKFECIYLRPTNAQSDDPVRRNRSIQYISYPDYKFDRLRTESPGKYESYANIVPGEWIKIKIEVKGTTAKLYVNDSSQPALTVKDLKHGADLNGSIGLWVDKGTEAYFSNLEIIYY